LEASLNKDNKTSPDFVNYRLYCTSRDTS